VRRPSDEELAGRVRELIGSDPELTESKMLGGLTFLIRGNIAIAASSKGGAMVCVDSAKSDCLLATTKAPPVNMLGRDMPGWSRARQTTCAPRSTHDVAPGAPAITR
jgi:hypothetical protein